MHKISKHLIVFSIGFLSNFSSYKLLYSQQIKLPDIGDSGAALVTLEQEQRTGEAVIRNIRRAGGIVNDAILENYINHIGHQLVAASIDKKTPFHFYIINDSSINAFALPGGYIGVNYGLILSIQNENELAGVLAHEIAHVTQRHHVRSYAASSNTNTQILAAVIAALILGGSNPEFGQAAIATVIAGSAQKQINFTRSNESESDRVGIELLADSGYDPVGMADAFQIMSDSSRLYGAQIPEYLLTHPVSSTRLADARNRAASLSKPKQKKQLQFHLARSRLRVITSSNSTDTLKAFNHNLKTGSYLNPIAEMYGFTLILIQKRQFQKAKKYLKILTQSEPNSIAIKLLQAQLAFSSNKKQQALALLKQALSLYPANPILTEYYADMLLKTKQAKLAREILHTFLRQPTENPIFFKLLSKAENDLNNAIGAHEALAKFYYNMGQTHNAIEQISIALKDKKIDFYTSSRLESRLKELQNEQKLLQKTDSH